MTIYALISPQGTIDRRASNIDPSVQTKTGWKWLPLETVNPDYDPATQVKEGPAVTVEAKRVLETYTVRSKTAPELDSDKTARVDRVDAASLAVVFNHENRIRALEGKAAVTLAQFKTAVKALV